MINDSTPEIKVTIKSGTNIIGSSIVMKIDGNPVSLPSYSNATQINVSYTPTTPLSDGQHSVYIYAKNSLDLEDDNIANQHGFTIPV